MAENFQRCHNFSKKTVVYWKSRKLEASAKNFLKSLSCTATLIRRAMEYSNVIMFEMLFMFCHFERKC